ncbi:hypothetical protein JOD64_000811 [Micromonospora luteifusca]|uniref:Uncharacterized protein n=1 Tax=Micromonospora luteifusca TaxID=709860 RepID=A0ABS2LPL3_9ACTN|nr:hypothetical protein [Micromonospora luteifusca]MBM7489589.1 hypothetical protein [Micromonospora luteifusca]
MRLVDELRDRLGVEPVLRVIGVATSTRVHPRAAVGAARPVVHRPDLVEQLGVVTAACAAEASGH